MKVHLASQRRACAALSVERSTVRYRSRQSEDGNLRDAIKRVSKERRRFGHRRIHVMVRREGFEGNHKKLRRICRENLALVPTRLCMGCGSR
ncbi:HTH-like domain-containing protein [Shimia aestuarii]|uniref:HTH-like domain-containing protein n=2 Tax=Shimia aestuarii TaxID=254406 RepID=A0A1I4IQK1_9RHOB|nr:HTH-like domain-containing protein [Shimia aestuarii]